MNYNFLQLFQETVKHNPDRVVVVDQDGTRRTTYAELDRLARQVAAYLRSCALPAESYVPIILPYCMEYFAAEIGIWMAGYAMVPLDDHFPEDRVKYILDNCQAPLIIDMKVFETLSSYEPMEEIVARDPDTPVALFYTSGSTGAPKGIVHTVGSLNSGISHNVAFGFKPEDSYGSLVPFYFIASVSSLYMFGLGMTVHLYPNDARTDVRCLEEYILKHELTTTFISPAVLAKFRNKFQNLRMVLTGSERLSGIGPTGYILQNCYGMTEAGGPFVFFNVDKVYDNTPIGRAASDVEIFIVDDEGNPVPAGEEGELCVKGNFTRGYFRDEEKTKILYQGGMLHTGDIVKMLPDGNMLYMNRKDWMVKINGQRVEPGEVELSIKQISGVDNAIVKGFTSDTGSQYLCAYFIAQNQISEQEIRDILSRKLPPYMVPLYFIRMEKFPINQNGKLDRKSLLPPDRSAMRAEYTAPQNEVQKKLCEAFASVLGLEQVGIDDDFFRLGGDSIRIMALLKHCPNLPLSAKLIYSERTPRQIATRCADDISLSLERREDYPLSQTQMGIYIESMNRQGEAAYNNPRLYRLGKRIDLQRLVTAVEAVVKTHPFIKTRLFTNAEGEPRQRRNEGENYCQKIETLSDTAFKALIPDLVQPFNLLADELFRFRLIQTDSDSYMFVDFHHIIFDGTSFGVLMEDLNVAYKGGIPEPELWSSFEVAQEEEALHKTDVYTQAKAWCLNTFGDLDIDSQPLPDRNISETRFGKQSVTLSLEYEKLESFCKENGVTMNVLTTAAFGYLLGVYSNTADSLFAAIYNGRTKLQTARTIGMLVKTLAVYCRWEAETTVVELLHNLMEQILGSMNHDIYSFAELSSQSQVSSKILFAYQGNLQLDNRIAGEAVEDIPLIDNATGEILTVQLFRTEQGLTLTAEYHDNLYSPEFIRCFLDSYEVILNELTTKQLLRQVTITAEKQIAEQDLFNATEMPYDTTQSVITLFRRQVALNPETVAVVFKDRRYTYRQVDELSERIGQYIKQKGIKKGEFVSILIPRCEYMAIASLGVLKAECAFQPLDPTYPADRLIFMMQDANARLLITTEALRDLIQGYTGNVLLTSAIADLPDTGEKLQDAIPDDLFVLLYTSGSTGKPKGCQLDHGNLVAFCNWHIRYYDLHPGDNVGSHASYGFDVHMMDIYPTLTYGATCHILEEDIRLDLIALNEYLEKNSVSHLAMTTQVGRQFAINIDNHSLKHLSTAGEKLVSLDPPAGYHFYNAYGPTECTILATAYEVTEREDNIPIGKPLSNIKLYIVDRYGRRVPIGAMGELWIAGRQVSCGYLNRPEQTQKVYIPNPFNDASNYKRIYCSGDVVRYRTDGNIEFIGRRDSQVKIRGFRIELTEIEGIIREFPGIKDATVVAYDDPSEGKYVVAYVVSDETVDISLLHAFIRESKPPYLVPAVTMQIDAIPLNQNMKVNKRALPKPELITAKKDGSENDMNRPPNLLETELMAIIEDIVHTSNFGVTTDLGYMGLTSIAAIKLSACIFKRFGVNIPSKVLVKGASVQSIANELIRHWMENPKTQAVEQAVTPPQQNTYPLSYAQQGVYYDCMKRPAEIIYNIPALLSFTKNTNPEKLAEAVKKLILAHPYVMTHFEMQGEKVVQLRETHEVQILRKDMNESELEVYKKEFVRPFNLSKAPLYRMTVVQTEQRTCLLLDFHHLIFDGASFDIFFNGLKRELEGLQAEKEIYTYYDYVADEKQAEHSSRYEDDKAFFDHVLSGCEGAGEITSDLNGLPENGKLEEYVLPLDKNMMDRYCKENHVTPAAFCLAGAFYTVSRYVNNRQVYMSTISNGRSDVRTADTFGMFVKTLPLAMAIDEQTSQAFVQQAGQILSDTIGHENYPFSKISADYGFTPEIVYACQLGVVDEWTLHGDRVEMEGMELKIAKFKLSIHIEERNGSPAIVLQYNNALYSHELMENFAISMATALDRMAKEPSAPIKHVSLLNPIREKQLEGFRESGTAEIETKLFHQGLEVQAALHPAHTALIAAEGSYTYAELNACANRIAHALIDLGLKPHSRVAILLPRTGSVIMSMFGVMKTGSAYIPCDPDYPVERINHILEDSGATYVITTANRMSDFTQAKALDVEMLLAGCKKTNPNIAISPEDLAYLIYTSGSTGKPKGVMLHHAGICNYLTAHPLNRHVHALVSDAKMFLSVTTVSFDMSLKEIGTTLFNGLTLVLANEDQANNPILLTELFTQTGADAFNATPSRMLQYMELPAFCQALSHCKVIMCGGEKYADRLLDRLRSITKARIFNTYGPTEITVSSNCKELTHADEISIGSPLLNYKEYIVDCDGNELPLGVVGELYIGGIGVAKGYHNLNEMTRDRFIAYKNGRIYRSGDYARWTPQGDVVVLGRTDNQIKLRGLRIELGEIEAAISRIEGMKSAVVMIRKIHGNEQLCAYFTANYPIDIPTLKEALKATLAPYMIPTAYLQMESLPLTPNGKTDLKALPEPELLLGGRGEKAANETERCFCEIFAQILELDTVGATDSFFDLGGTSLTVTRIIIEANNAGYQIAYGDVFSHPTPRALASLIKNMQESEENRMITDYDYSTLQKILDNNTLENFIGGEQQPLNDILLTGATGFLGVHILKEFLDTQSGKVYCLLRGKGNITAETRLKTVLFYYFEDSFDHLFGTRICTINGDVTDSQALKPLADKGISTVINCAANVKHFSEGTDIEDVNIGGTNRLIGFCLQTGARLVHVSTMSVGGLSVNGKPEPGMALTERMLYFGQFIDNKYINSKFLAERLILENIRDKNLNAKIMRVGNLSARNSDGEFQINYSTNSFMGRLKSYRLLGKCAYDQLDASMEFSPIDEVAKSILLLSTSPKPCCIFHPYNHHYILLGDIFSEMKQLGFSIEAVEAPEFAKTLAEAEANPAKAKILSSMIAYQNMAHGKAAHPTPKNNTYTMQVLYRLSYHWPVTSWDYVTRFLQSLQGLGFFDE